LGADVADRDRELLKGNTPTLVMAVLRDGALHGYAIARAIESRSRAALHCKEGTLYPALQALERDGLICGKWERSPAGRERKVYSLTDAGLARLVEDTQQWERFAFAIGRVLGGGSEDAPTDGKPHGIGGWLPRPAEG
jgi:PadR family transcriptional regulator PadR